jgi:hypothetical protein
VQADAAIALGEKKKTVIRKNNSTFFEVKLGTQTFSATFAVQL